MQDNFYFKKINESNFTKYDKDDSDIGSYKKYTEPQINWYNNKATDNLYRYNTLQRSTPVTSYPLSIVNVISNLNLIIRILSSVFGGTIVAATRMTQLTKAQETSLLYRSTAETLMKEYDLYMLKVRSTHNSQI